MRTLRYPSEIYYDEKMPFWMPLASVLNSALVRGLSIGEGGRLVDSQITLDRVNAVVAQFVLRSAYQETETEQDLGNGLKIKQRSTNTGVGYWYQSEARLSVETEFEREGQVASTSASVMTLEGRPYFESAKFDYVRNGDTAPVSYWHNADTVGALQFVTTVLATGRLATQTH